MTGQTIDVEEVLAELKDFQRRTARWAFQRMFADRDPAIRFLVADEVGLGKTHVAKGVIAQVIDHLRRTGDARHDIIYVCSNAAIARQNVRKLTPEGIEPLEDVGRLTMLPLAELDDGDDGQTGVNLLAITPGTSLKFGHQTGRFRERCLAYTFLRAHWGASVMNAPARRIFWHGIRAGDPDGRLRWVERQYRPRIIGSLGEFAKVLTEADKSRMAHGKPTVRELFEDLASRLAWKRKFPHELQPRRKELIGEVRGIMARVGIAALQPDLVVLDEFQRFKDLLQPAPDNFAAELAHRLFDYSDPETGRATRTLLLSATPYRMYTTADEIDGDHYEDLLATCSFLFQDPARVDRLRHRFRALRSALTSAESLDHAEDACGEIGAELRGVMARTERLAATPDRDGMLCEWDAQVPVEPDDLRAYLRLGGLAEAVKHHEPAEYWKSAPYLVNFMEGYKLKEGIVQAAADGRFADDVGLDPGPGLLTWDDVEAYRRVDPQNGRLRWLLDDLESSTAPSNCSGSLRRCGTTTPDRSTSRGRLPAFTKRLIFSGWAVVPKVISSMVSFEAERRAFAARSHNYTADYGRRGGQRLAFRTTERTSGGHRPGEAVAGRRAAAMTAFTPHLAEPQPRRARRSPAVGAGRPPPRV